MKKNLILLTAMIFLLFSCAEKASSGIYDDPLKDTPENKDDKEDQLPKEEVEEEEVEEVDQVDSEDDDNEDFDEEDFDEEDFDDGEVEVEEDNDLVVDEDVEPVIEPCFEKKCSTHDECSVENESCFPFDPLDRFGCGPDYLEELGYRGKDQCLLLNCDEDSDCKGSTAYVCLHFDSAIPEFLNAESVCVRSLAGSECYEDGKKVCQAGMNIALKCVDGKWKPYLCGSTSFCEDGECKPIEYPAKMVISVDDLLVNLCVNGNFLTDLGTNKGAWTHADEYNFNLVPGINVIGVHGRDTGYVVSAFMATIEVLGELYITDGVMPPADDVEYTPSDPEWDATLWRYFPDAVGSPRNDWCDKFFDDSEWGPAIRAGTASTPIDEWGHLGAHPWVNTSCGFSRCPGEFLPYYEDHIEGNEPMWVWDYKPVELNDAWFRFVIYLP